MTPHERTLSLTDSESLRIGSGLEPGTIRSRGYWTANTPEELAAIGFAEYQSLAPALVVPIHTVDGGESELFQIRPQTPRLNDAGKPIKYETTAGKFLRIDCPPSGQRLLGDPREPLWITEGCKKADAAAQRGFCVIDLLGVWNWRGSNDAGGVCELPDWDRIAIKGRVIFIAFDNDVMIKPGVRASLIRLAAMLKRRGAESVHAVVFPPYGDGKVGFDDYFVRGGTVAELADGDFIDDSLLGGAIDIVGKGLPELTQKAIDAVLMETDPPKMYVRAGALVRVTVGDNGAPIIGDLGTGSLRGIVANASEWRKKGGVIFPPKDVIENILTLGDWPSIPPLVTIARAPVLTPSGSLTGGNGYFQEAKTFVSTGHQIPEWAGTAKDAANWIISEVLGDFPFAGPADIAHALSLMLLPIVRPFIQGPTPLHLVDAPTQGTGKTLLAMACLAPTQGSSIVITPGTHDEEEWRKKIGTCLLSGAPYVMFDNLTKKIDSEALTACLTGSIWADRFMSTMRPFSVEIKTTWVATANNADLSRDILRRTAWIRLDSQMERPEDRSEYKHKYIIPWINSNRGTILSALICMVSEWLTVRKPNKSEDIEYKGRKLGTFEVWSSVMGSILEVAGVEGFLSNIDELRAQANAEDGAWAEFFERWWQAHGSTSVRATDVLDLFKADDVLAGMVGDKGELSQANRLGRILGSMVKVVRADKFIKRTNGRNNSSTFALELVPMQKQLFDSEPTQSMGYGGMQGLDCDATRVEKSNGITNPIQSPTTEDWENLT